MNFFPSSWSFVSSSFPSKVSIFHNHVSPFSFKQRVNGQSVSMVSWKTQVQALPTLTGSLLFSHCCLAEDNAHVAMINHYTGKILSRGSSKALGGAAWAMQKWQHYKLLACTTNRLGQPTALMIKAYQHNRPNIKRNRKALSCSPCIHYWFYIAFL